MKFLEGGVLENKFPRAIPKLGGFTIYEYWIYSFGIEYLDLTVFVSYL